MYRDTVPFSSRAKSRLETRFGVGKDAESCQPIAQAENIKSSSRSTRKGRRCEAGLIRMRKEKLLSRDRGKGEMTRARHFRFRSTAAICGAGLHCLCRHDPRGRPALQIPAEESCPGAPSASFKAGETETSSCAVVRTHFVAFKASSLP